MKYNVKDAVSGIQGQMDSRARNQMLGTALKGLGGGIESARAMGFAKDQTTALNSALGQQSSFYDELINDPKASRIEKLMARESKLKLGLLRSGLNINTVGGFGKNYKDMFSGGSMFDPMIDLQKAGIIASGYAGRKAEKDAEDEYYRNAANNNQNSGLGGFGRIGQGVDNIFSGIGQMNPFGRQQKPNSSLGYDAEF